MDPRRGLLRPSHTHTHMSSGPPWTTLICFLGVGPSSDCSGILLMFAVVTRYTLYLRHKRCKAHRLRPSQGMLGHLNHEVEAMIDLAKQPLVQHTTTIITFMYQR